MSQSAVATAPGSTVVPSTPEDRSASGSGSLAGRVRAAGAAVRHSLEGTPGHLRLVSGVAILAALVVGIGGGAALRERSAAIDEASRAASHLVLVQRVQTQMVQADADATNSYLRFGPELASQRLDYLASVRAASADLVTAAQAEEAEGLSAANAALTRYTGYVASARANNLQGLPVGISYLQEANQLLQDGILPQLADSAAADTARVDAAYDRAGRSWWWLAAAVLLGLGGLIWAQSFVARHSRRILNLPLLAGSIAVLVAVVVGVVAMVAAQGSANDVRDGALARTTALSAARVAAYNAKSIESLSLIDRGSGATREPTWTAAQKEAATQVRLGGDTAGIEALQEYVGAHQSIRKADDAGNWKGARQAAVSTANGSSNATFAAFAGQTAGALAEQSRQVGSGLDDAGRWLLPVGLLVLLAGLLAAVLAWWGVTLRLDEYR